LKPAFVFTPDLCTGCEACRVACGNENTAGLDTGWRQVTTFNLSRHPGLPTRHLSLACNHCERPACALGCPARAYRRDERTDALLVDDEKCIGCRYCSWVCPYDAPRFDEARGVMSKCTFCAHRLAEGLAPACAAACPTGALALGKLPEEPAEPSFHGLGAFGLGPALVVNPSRRTTPPEGLIGDDPDALPPSFPPRPRKTSLASEKGILLFTLAMPALAAWFAGGLRVPSRAPALVPFLALAALAFGLSTGHLGQPLRAWRAVLGFGTSWLSREIVAAGAFVVLALPYVGLPHASPEIGLPALLASLLLVASIDGVYLAVPRASGPRLHGAEATTAFLLLAGIAAGLTPLTTAMAALKALLLVRRNRAGALGLPPGAALLRLGLLAAALLPIGWGLAFVLALASEGVDRASFYEGLEPSTPASRMEAEARAALASA
jgi:Fe-S-cluster-containing dehydrogenase component/DMSO reductase anchor subunit